MLSSIESARRDKTVAFLFPGQGAQAAGMGRQVYEASDAARSVFQEVDSALGRPLSDLLLNGSEDAVRETVNAQPAIMAVSLACHRAMEDELGAERDAAAGRSWRATAWESTRRSPFPASWTWRTRLGWCRSGGGSCRRRATSAPVRWPRSWGWTR